MVCERAEKILCFIRNIKSDSKFAIPNRLIRSLLQHVDARFMNYLKWSTFCRHKKVKRKSRNIALCEKCPNAEVFLFFLSVFGHFTQWLPSCKLLNEWSVWYYHSYQSWYETHVLNRLRNLTLLKKVWYSERKSSYLSCLLKRGM